jgi:hypothetical protein
MKKLTSLRVKLAILGSLMALGLTSAQAASYYWDNSTSGDLSTRTNWSNNPTGGTPRTKPTPTDEAIFSATDVPAGNNLTATASTSNTQFLDLQFLGSHTGTTLLEGVDNTGHMLSLGGGSPAVPGGSITILTVNSGAGAVTIGNATNTLDLRNQIANPGNTFSIINNSTNPLTIQNGLTVNLNAAGVGTFEIGGSGKTVFNGVISDQGANKNLALTVDNGAVATLANANTFTGDTLIQGRLNANATGALGAGTKVTVDGGSLVFGANNAVDSSDKVVLSGGGSKLVLNGTTQTIGTLTLKSGANTIDLTGGGILTISDIGSWATNATLNIIGWVGPNNFTGDATHQIILGSGALAFFASNPGDLADITWSNTSTDGGATFGSFTTARVSGFQLTPVPEPSTLFIGFLLLALLGWHGRRKIAEVVGSSLNPVRA